MFVFGKFGVLCFLETPVLRFSPYCRRIIIVFLGIFGTVTVDDNEVRKWKISSLDFEEDWTKR